MPPLPTTTTRLAPSSSAASLLTLSVSRRVTTRPLAAAGDETGSSLGLAPAQMQSLS